MDNLVLRGSQTDKNGFKNEQEIAVKFNNWVNDTEAQKWLIIMMYRLDSIEWVKAIVLHGYKADLNVQVQIKLKDALDIENIQIKLVSNKKGFNQVDKRWLHNYNDMWHIPEDTYKLLQYFTGELAPYKSPPRDHRRMFLDEMTEADRHNIIYCFYTNTM